MLDFESATRYINDHINEIERWWWWYVREISWQLIVAPIAYLLVCLFLYFVLKRVSHRAWQLPGPPARLLLVIAHPDDEVMFFGPMIYWLTKYKTSNIYLLCFTIGI